MQEVIYSDNWRGYNGLIMVCGVAPLNKNAGVYSFTPPYVYSSVADDINGNDMLPVCVRM